MYPQVPPETVIESRVLESCVADDNDVAVSAECRVICLERFHEDLRVVWVLLEMRMFDFTRKLCLATPGSVLGEFGLEVERAAIGVRSQSLTIRS